MTGKPVEVYSRTNKEGRASGGAFDAARIEDLGPGYFVKMECIACGHDTLIPAGTLLQGLRLPPTSVVLDLEPRLRCRECDPTREGGGVNQMGKDTV
jgi:hypothetical protein